MLLKIALALLLATALASASQEKKGKFSIFQVVEFPNEYCEGDNSKNGTCYTKEECEDKGGVSSGSCAEGYGVCCVQTLNCGDTSAENYVFLTKPTTLTSNSQCSFKICPCSNNICRIRYDFMDFTLAAPVEGTTTAAATTDSPGGAIGDCLTDTFSISSQGARGSPVICGVNTGQHMIIDVDAKRGCQTASFTIGSGDTPTRAWDIKVTQYGCGDEDNSGPAGCLQWFTETKGTISSFNFPIGTTSNVIATTTHLSNQQYNVCIKQSVGLDCICYTATEPAGAALTVATQGNFGVSVSTDAAAKSATNANCAADHVVIPDAFASVNPLVVPAIANLPTQKLCGRKLNSADSNAATATVCTGVKPFILGVNFDANEVTMAAGTAIQDERKVATGGIVGFRLAFEQKACTYA